MTNLRGSDIKVGKFYRTECDELSIMRVDRILTSYETEWPVRGTFILGPRINEECTWENERSLWCGDDAGDNNKLVEEIDITKHPEYLL